MNWIQAKNVVWEEFFEGGALCISNKVQWRKAS